MSFSAISVAMKNLTGHPDCSERIRLLQGDLLDGLHPDRARFHLIVSNPPYVPTESWDDLAPEVREYEPRVALDGGAPGNGDPPQDPAAMPQGSSCPMGPWSWKSERIRPRQWPTRQKRPVTTASRGSWRTMRASRGCLWRRYEGVIGTRVSVFVTVPGPCACPNSNAGRAILGSGGRGQASDPASKLGAMVNRARARTLYHEGRPFWTNCS